MAYLSNPASVLAPWTAALASALVLATMLPQPAAAQTTPTKRSPIPEQTSPTKAVDNGRYYALVIGIDTYPAPLPSLKTAENDAQAIAKTLRSDYGFEVKLLLGADARRNHVLAAVNQYEGTLQPNDNLLIYYAGHGYENKATGKAYWLPADADSTYSPNRIIADDITSEMAAIPARHILVISDSCYSGGLTREAPATPRAALQSDAFLKRMLSSRSRTLMASGGDEPVSDAGRDNHSIFAYALLQALNAEAESMFSASDLFYSGVRQRVAGSSDQLPQYAIIRNSTHDDGDFIFMRADALEKGIGVTPVETPSTREVSPVSASPAPSEDNVPVPMKPSPSVGTGTSDFDRANLFYKAKDYQSAFPLMKAVCDAGDLRGCSLEGSMYAFYGGVPRDDTQAVALYRRACDGGTAAGCSGLGYMYQHGSGGLAEDKAQAIAFYKKGCDGDDAEGCSRLGFMYEIGWGKKRDKVQSVALYGKGCDGGNAEGCFWLGELYEQGTGIKRDRARAIDLYKRSCDGGNQYGCDNLKRLQP